MSGNGHQKSRAGEKSGRNLARNHREEKVTNFGYGLHKNSRAGAINKWRRLVPATSAYQLQIQTESNPNPTGIPLPNSSTNCWTLFTCTRGSAEAQHKKSHCCLELLLLLLLLLLQLGVGCYSGCCLRFCQLIWQATAPGTRHKAPGHFSSSTYAHRGRSWSYSRQTVCRGERGNMVSMGGEQFGCDLMQQKADKVISGTRKP